MTAVVRPAGHGWGTSGASRNRTRRGTRSGWAGGSERDDADLFTAELGHVVAVGGQHGDRFRLAERDLGNRGVLVSVQLAPLRSSAAALAACTVTGSTLMRDRAQFRQGMLVRE